LPIVVCITGGSLAWDLAKQNEAANVAFARDRLRALLGANADRGLRAGAAPNWGANQLTLGAYAVARPGMWRARNALLAPIGDRVFLAGEALAGKAAQTAHGAYVSGQTVARRVLQKLKI
jgi:monoamine oxidase